jgi:photosystem II stability/assembly factor-like uncharacterized protein
MQKMKNPFFLLTVAMVFLSCQQMGEEGGSLFQNKEVCDFQWEIQAPAGWGINTIGTIDFEGSIQAFQFVSEQVGYALGSKNVGGYAEAFKTTDGGQTWTNLNIGFEQHPRSMVFKNENFGLITVHDVTGCPPPNCENRCVILKTENGGLDWEEVVYEDLQGILYHPKFDEEGVLYANLWLDGQTTLMKSTDNGVSWDSLFASPALDVSLVTFSLDLYKNLLFVTGKDGKLLVVSTQGELVRTIDLQQAVWDLEIVDENNLVVAGGGEVIKSSDGGQSWERIYDRNGRLIGFDSVDEGLAFLEKSICPTDVYQVNDVLATTRDGGLSWLEPAETTTNLRSGFVNSQKINPESWHFMYGKTLIELREN